MRAPAKKTPRPHQLDALAAIRTAGKRAMLRAACGSGKTLIQKWAVDQQAPRRAVVFVPSLALMDQTIREWGVDNWLAVCSDDTVGGELQVDLAVTNDPETIARFNGVVFCTYQSAELLAGQRFDLGIFDEAHKTAGAGAFSFALHDENVRIKQRLFFTATPRTHAEDPKIYGPTIYSLSHRQAVEAGLVVPFRLVVTTYTGSIENGDGTALVAIAKACEKYSLRKVLSFHNSVERATEAAARCPLPTRYERITINGAMSAAHRRGVLEAFSKAEFALLTNCKYLTEGVDIPAIDAVAYADPKGSGVDIVQSASRACRNSTGKHVGTIVIPLHVNEKTGAVDGDFGRIVEVLLSLRDDVPIEFGAAKRPESTEQVVRRALAEGQLEIDTPLESLREAIRLEILDEMHCSWSRRLREVLLFKAAHGRFPTTTEKDAYARSLGVFCHDWRMAYKKGKPGMPVTPTRARALEDSGIATYDNRYEKFESNTAAYAKFIDKNGREPKRSSSDPEERRLAGFASDQRLCLRGARDYKLTPKRRQLLAEIGITA